MAPSSDPPSNDPIAPLRASPAVSPDNDPLRRHFLFQPLWGPRFTKVIDGCRRLLDGTFADAELETRLAAACFQDDNRPTRLLDNLLGRVPSAHPF